MSWLLSIYSNWFIHFIETLHFWEKNVTIYYATRPSWNRVKKERMGNPFLLQARLQRYTAWLSVWKTLLWAIFWLDKSRPVPQKYFEVTKCNRKDFSLQLNFRKQIAWSSSGRLPLEGLAAPVLYRVSL